MIRIVYVIQTENAMPGQSQGGATGGFNFGQSQSVPAAATFNFNAAPSNNLFAGQNAAPSMPAGPGSFTIGQVFVLLQYY